MEYWNTGVQKKKDFSLFFKPIIPPFPAYRRAGIISFFPKL